MTSPRTDAQTSVAFRPAAFWARALALLIDVVVPVLVTGTVFFTCFQVSFDLDKNGNVAAGYTVLMIGLASVVLLPLIALTVNVWLARTRRFSVGKFILGIRIVDAHTTGAVRVGRLLERVGVLALPVISTVPLAWTLFGIVAQGGLVGLDDAVRRLGSVGVIPLVIWVIFSLPMLRGERRGWQDRVAKSRVVTAASVAQSPG